MKCKEINNPNFAEEMADVNSAAFGYRSIPIISKYRIKQRIGNLRYKAYGCFIKKTLTGFLFVDNKPNEFVCSPSEKLIEHFGVLPWRQGEGIGYILLSYIINVKFPLNSFHLTVDPLKHKVRSFYRKFDFIEYGETHMVLMRKNETVHQQQKFFYV